MLIESNAVKTLAFGQTVEKFGQRAMDQLIDYHKEHGGISRFKKFEWFYSEVIKVPLSDAMMDTLCDRFTQLCIDAVQSDLCLMYHKGYSSGEIQLFLQSE